MENNENVQFPPQSLSQLSHVLSLMQQGQISLRLGKRCMTALRLMLDDPAMAATQNITQLSRTTGVSPASLTRLAKLLGFVGFKAFQLLFKQYSKIPERYYSAQARALIDSKQEHGFVTERLETQKASLDNVLLNLDKTQLAHSIAALINAQRVWVYGSRQSFSMASLLSYELSLVRKGVNIINAAGDSLSAILNEVSLGDLMVVIGSNPYSRSTVLLAKTAKSMGLPLLAITDSIHSPLAQVADICLMADSQSRFYTNSMVSTVFLIETLLIEVTRRLGDKAVDHLRTREELISKLNDEF